MHLEQTVLIKLSETGINPFHFLSLLLFYWVKLGKTM